MASTVDLRTLAAVVTSLVTALTSGTSVTTASLATAIGNQQSNDTGLTVSTSGILTQITAAVGSATPSTTINNFFK